MSTLTTAEKNSLLGATTITHVAAFDADPAGAGVQIGSRAAVSWAAAANGQRVASSAPQISITGGNSVAWYGFFDAATGGTLRGTHQLAAPEVFGADGTLTVDNPLPTISLPDPA